MQVVYDARVGRSNSYCNHKSCLNRDVLIASLLNWRKIESHFETWSSDAQRINLTFAARSFVANFVRYISAKYYLNWFSYHTDARMMRYEICTGLRVSTPYQQPSPDTDAGFYLAGLQASMTLPLTPLFVTSIALLWWNLIRSSTVECT